MRAAGIWEISVPSSRSCYEPKSTLKNAVLKRRRGGSGPALLWASGRLAQRWQRRGRACTLVSRAELGMLARLWLPPARPCQPEAAGQGSPRAGSPLAQQPSETFQNKTVPMPKRPWASLCVPLFQSICILEEFQTYIQL